MPRFSFHMSQGGFSKPEISRTFESCEAARQEALAICTDLGRDIFGGLKPGSGWQMNVTDEDGKAIFQIKLYSWVFE